MLIIVFIIILVHALIHLYGFINNWFLPESTQMSWKSIVHLSKRSVKVIGILWLMTFFIFIVSAIALASGMQWWKIMAVIGVVSSQLLLILYIKNTWFGTITNIIIILAIILL